MRPRLGRRGFREALGAASGAQVLGALGVAEEQLTQLFAHPLGQHLERLFDAIHPLINLPLDALNRAVDLPTEYAERGGEVCAPALLEHFRVLVLPEEILDFCDQIHLLLRENALGASTPFGFVIWDAEQ
eukprot:6847728-Prymnesium_polylepis.1